MIPNFTMRQAQVAAMLCRGLSAKEMARKLDRSARTAEELTVQVINACQVPNREQAVYFLGNIDYLNSLPMFLNPQQIAEIA